MSDCGFTAWGCFAGAREAFGLAVAAARGLVADVVLGFAFDLVFDLVLDLATDFGLPLAFGLALPWALALAFAALVLAAAALVFDFGADLGLAADLGFGADLDFGASLGLREAAFRVRAGLAVALPLFELFAMILAFNSLSAASACNPRGVLATALNTFQVFLPPPLPCGFTPC